MNRRGFFKKLALATAAFSILPTATTYARTWKIAPESSVWIPNPEWELAPYQMSYIWHPGAVAVFPKGTFDIGGYLGPTGQSAPKAASRFKIEDGKLVKVEPFFIKPHILPAGHPGKGALLKSIV